MRQTPKDGEGIGVAGKARLVVLQRPGSLEVRQPLSAFRRICANVSNPLPPATSSATSPEIRAVTT
jgi:hypothetical protein